MAETTHIEWTDATWNPVTGCTLVDDGCANCYRYMEASEIRCALARHDLRGKDLACWCPLDQPCHADVLLEIANR